MTHTVPRGRRVWLLGAGALYVLFDVIYLTYRRNQEAAALCATRTGGSSETPPSAPWQTSGRGEGGGGDAILWLTTSRG